MRGKPSLGSKVVKILQKLANCEPIPISNSLTENLIHSPINARISTVKYTVVWVSQSKTHTYILLEAVLIVDGGLEAVDGKCDDAGKDGGSTVDKRDNDGLALKVVVVRVVAGKSDE